MKLIRLLVVARLLCCSLVFMILNATPAFAVSKIRGAVPPMADRIKIHVPSPVGAAISKSADVALTNGVQLNNQSVTEGDWNFYSINVPAGMRNLTVATTNSTGDVDLYVRFNNKPDGVSFDCAPYTYSGNETCVMTDPTPGIWWVGVYGWEAGNYSIKATFSTIAVNRTVTPSVSGGGGTISPNTVQTVVQGATKSFTVTPNAGYVVSVSGTCGGVLSGNIYTTFPVTTNCTVIANFTYPVQLTNGVQLNNQSVTFDAWKYYKITVSAGMRNLTVATTNSTGDVDLYVRFNNKPDGDNFDCAPYTDSGNETCVMADPTPGIWWVGVHGWEAGNYSIKATFSTIAVNRTVTPSVSSGGGTISPNTVQTVVHGATKVFTVTPNAGYVAGVGGTCGGVLSGNIYTTSPVTTNCTVVVSFSLPVQLTNGVQLNNQSVTFHAWKYYTITVPAGMRNLTVATTNSTGDFDLYVRFNNKPDGVSFDCAPYTDSGNETCVMADPTPGIWWVGVHGWEAGNYSIKATFSTIVVNRTVTPSVSSGGGTISPNTVQTVVHGATKVFTVTPNAGYVVSVSGTCGGVLSGNIYTTSPVIANCTVIANFTYPVQLTNGVQLNNQSVTFDAWKYYKITVSAGMRNLTVATTNSTGDVDLYVRFNNKPDGVSFDCAPYTYSGNETCVMADPTPGIWWVGVHGWEAGNYSIKATFSTIVVNRTVTPSVSSGGGTISPNTVQTVVHGATKVFTVTPNAGYVAGVDGTCGGVLSGNIYTTSPVIANCTVVVSFSLPVQLTNGVQLNNQSVTFNAWKYYTITVPAGMRNLTVATTNSTGDVDLYVRFNNKPDGVSFDCARYTDSGNETCVMADPTPGIWWVGVYGWDAGNYSIKATFSTYQLTNGVQLNSQSVALHAWKYYTITVPAGKSNLTVATTNSTGDVDLYVRFNNKPDGVSFDCAPYTYSGNETCVMTDPTPGIWWVGVYGWEAGNYSIRALWQ